MGNNGRRWGGKGVKVVLCVTDRLGINPCAYLKSIAILDAQQLPSGIHTELLTRFYALHCGVGPCKRLWLAAPSAPIRSAVSEK